MRSILALTLLVTALGAAPAQAGSGGTTLPVEQAPYIAWLGGRCTGTLISPTRILTAAHCLDGQDIADARVLVGIDGNTLNNVTAFTFGSNAPSDDLYADVDATTPFDYVLGSVK